MERAEFDSVVREAEQYARERPLRYRLRVIGLGFLGYAYLVAVLAGLVGALVVLGAIAPHHAYGLVAKSFIAILVLIGLVLRALWVRFEPPGGRNVTRSEVPRLFELVDNIVAQTGAPRVAAINLTGDLNAAIVQRPRFGPIFGYRNFLIVGLPLLEALSLEEFRAVLAHECGHLSGAHGKASAWVYRIRASWSALASRLEASEHWGRWLFVPFFHWYAPRFQAYSFVMAREQEYAADAVAATVTSPAASGAALVRVAFASRWLDERFWPSIFREPERSAEPEVRPFATMAAQLAGGFTGADPDRWLAAELARDTGTTDTHPSLRDRLRALDVPEPRLGAVAAPAAESLLGAARAALITEIDAAWRRGMTEWWKKEHARRAEMRTRRTALEASATSAPLSLAEKLELAQLLQANHEPERAEPLLREVLGEAPDHADAHAYLGALLAKRDDPAAIGHLERAIQHDPAWTMSAGEILHGQLTRVGRKAEADALLARVREYHANAAAAKREAGVIRETQTYVALELGAAARAAVSEALRKEGSAVRRAWLVGRILVAGQAPVPLLVVERRAAWWRYASSTSASNLVKRLATAVPLPAGAQLIVLGDRQRWLLRRARSIAGAQVFPEGSR